MELKLLVEKLKSIRGEAKKPRAVDQVTAPELSRLLSKMNAATKVIAIALPSGASASFELIISELQHSNLPLAGGEGLAVVVDHPLHEVEWAEPYLQKT